jgi:hypothetical protein
MTICLFSQGATFGIELNTHNKIMETSNCASSSHDMCACYMCITWMANAGQLLHPEARFSSEHSSLT